MNHAEEPRLNGPPGDISREALQEGNMSYEWIALRALAEAYTLNIEEALAVAQHVPCRNNSPMFARERGPRPLSPGNLKRVDAQIVARARQLVEAPDQNAALAIFRNPIMYRGYKALLDSGAKETAIRYLAEAMRQHFLFSLHVMKPQAKQYLESAGFFPKESTLAATPPPTALPIDGDDAPTDTPTKQVSIPPAGQEGSSSKGEQQKMPVNVPLSLCAGKTPQAVFDALKELGYDDGLIALVIDEKCNATKTEKGRPFLPGGSDDSVYRRRLDTLVAAAQERYIPIFNE